MNPAFLLPYITVFALAILLQAAIEHRLGLHKLLPSHSQPIAAWGLTAFLGYLAFWAYFGTLKLGWGFTCGLFVGVIAYWIQNRRDIRGTFLGAADGHLCRFLMISIGAFYLGFLHLWQSTQAPEMLAANRFMPAMPTDNIIPAIFSDRLACGQSPKNLMGDWLSSDRPPLQTGFILLLRLPLDWMGSPSTRAFAASFLFQLFWIPGLWALLRSAGAKRTETLFTAGLVACTGFCLFHSVYAWPKLGAAGLVIGGTSLFLNRNPGSQLVKWSIGSALCALGYLSHGGVMFSLLALAPLTLLLKPTKTTLVASVIVFLLLLLPWSCYQNFYEPPGNRLVKWHIGGVIPIDKRGTMETIYTSYRNTSWPEIIKNKEANLAEIFRDGPWHIFDLSPANMKGSRAAEFFHFFRGLGLGSWLLLLLPLCVWRLQRKNDSAGLAHAAALITGWGLLTLIAWVLVQYGPGTTIIHQGSLVPLLTLWTIPVVALARWSRNALVAIAMVQFILFLSVWTIPWTPPEGPLSPSAMILVFSSICLFGAIAVITCRTPAHKAETLAGNG